MNPVRAGYDAVASEYDARISGELAGKPLDRALLDAFTEEVGSGPPVCDAGCGPGNVARYLKDRGVNVHGLDLSPAMVAIAARSHPDIGFRTGDLATLDGEPADLAGIVAFYSLIHLPRERVAGAIRNMKGHLRWGGLLLAGFQVGTEVVHLDTWWDRPVSLDFTFFRTAEMQGYLAEAGYSVQWTVTRDPYPGVEHPSARAYVLGAAR